MISAFDLLDKVIFGKFLPLPTSDQITEMLGAAKEKSADCTYNMIDQATEDIDAKTSALLTHISIIVASLTFLYTSQDGAFRVMFVIEICIYLLIAIMCLRAIKFTWTYQREASSLSEQNTIFATELGKRGELYGLAANLTVYVTIAMLAVDGVLLVVGHAAK